MKKIKEKLMNLAKKKLLFRKLFRNSLNAYRYICYKVRGIGLAVNEKKVLFSTFDGKGFSDSSKAIYLYMLNEEHFKDYQFVWVFKDVEKHRFLLENRNTTIVQRGSKEHEKALLSAKYIVVNHRVMDHQYPRKGQIYLQCWHGTPLKRLGFDLDKTENALNTTKEIQHKYLIEAKKDTYFLSPSAFATEKFISSFNLKGLGKEHIVIEQGYPRNDFLYNYTENDLARIREQLGIADTNKTIILYAPTWRDNQHTSGIGYTYKNEMDFDKLQEQLGEDYIILFRAHYFVANSFDFEKYEGFVYDVSSYDDINELYVVADMLITDYSSVFFDYANLKKPILFYMYDLEKYANNWRGFYIKLEELPGPIIEEQDELIAKILQINASFEYDEKYRVFNETYNYLDDGQASKRVVEIVMRDKGE